MKADFDGLSPELRRIILVASDDKYNMMKNAIDWKKFLMYLATGLSPVPLLARSYLQCTIQPSKDLFTRGEIPIPHLGPSEAKRRFQFDAGNPQDGQSYILDPIQEDYYLVPSLANERLAQKKVAAFFSLASVLGAKTLELVSAELHAQSAGGGVDVPLPQTAAQIGLQAKFNKAGVIARTTCAKFGRPSAPLHMPEALKPWLDLDPIMKSLAETRLTGSIEEMSYSLNIGSTIDVSAELLLDLAKRFHIGIGGEFHNVAQSTWTFYIHFWPKEVETVDRMSQEAQPTRASFLRVRGRK